MNKQEKLAEFKRDLAELLQKHSASIGFDCSEFSDTHGIYDACIVVYFDRPGTFPTEGLKITDGYGVSTCDLAEVEE